MKKASMLILSLVAVLTACNKNTGPNDWFAQLRRANKLTNAEKQEVINLSANYTYTMKYVSTVTKSHRAGTNLWYVDSEVTATTLGRTICNFNKTAQNSVAFATQQEGATDWNLGFNVTYADGKYSFGTAPGPKFIQDPKELYFKLYDTAFYWNISLFAGAHFYLAANDFDELCPQALLDKATQHEVFERVEPILIIPGQVSYETNGNYVKLVQDDMVYRLNSWATTYNGNRLSNYEIDMSITVFTNNNTSKTETHVVITTDSIVYA